MKIPTPFIHSHLLSLNQYDLISSLKPSRRKFASYKKDALYKVTKQKLFQWIYIKIKKKMTAIST